MHIYIYIDIYIYIHIHIYVYPTIFRGLARLLAVLRVSPSICLRLSRLCAHPLSSRHATLSATPRPGVRLAILTTTRPSNLGRYQPNPSSWRQALPAPSLRSYLCTCLAIQLYAPRARTRYLDFISGSFWSALLLFSDETNTMASNPGRHARSPRPVGHDGLSATGMFGTLCMIIQANGQQQDLWERKRNGNLHCEIIYIMQHVAEESVRALSLSFSRDVEDWIEEQITWIK